MAKRKPTRRPNLSQDTLERARAELRSEAGAVGVAESTNNVVAAKPKAKRTGTPSITRRIPTLEELLKEYHYVIVDLRNLAILATLLLVVIVVASLVLPRILG